LVKIVANASLNKDWRHQMVINQNPQLWEQTIQ